MANGQIILLAVADPDWLLPLICVVVVGVATVVLFGAFWFARTILKNGAAALRETYDGIEVRREGRVGDVELVFDTYHGFLGGGYKTKHHVFLAPDSALILLRRWHRFNMLRGWLCPGGLFVPFLSFASYRKQLKAIQARKTICSATILPNAG